MNRAEIKALRDEQSSLAVNARAKLEEITTDMKEDRAAEIEKEFDSMMESYDKIGKRADQFERVLSAEGEARAALEKIDESKRPNDIIVAGGVAEDAKLGYREAFHEYMRAAGNVGLLDPEVRAVLAAGYSKVKQPEGRAQTTAPDAAGGYTVPTELANIMTKSMLAWGPMYDPGVTTELVTTGGGPITMPTVDDTTTPVEKHVEGVTLTDDGGADVTFGSKTLNAYAFDTEFIRVSKELVDDSIFAMESLLGGLLGERLGRRANLELTTGDGVDDPNGIVTASSLGKTAAAADAITWDECLDLEHSVDPAYRMGPMVRYMFNDQTLLALRKLKDGDGNYLWQNGNVQAGIPPSFNGRAYSINQAVADIGASNKVMLFGDFSKYYVRKVGAPLVGAISDKDFWPGFGIAGYIRFDGELADAAAVKHLILAAT